MYPVAPAATANDVGIQHCRMLENTTKYAWFIPYIVVMMLETVVLALTLYKVLQFHNGIPKQSRPKLLDVFWIDGITNFTFMLLLGILNIVLMLKVPDPQLRDGGSKLHTVFHSILSTRIAIHTAEVLKQDVVGSQPTLARYGAWTGIEFAHVSETSTEVAAEDDAAPA